METTVKRIYFSINPLKGKPEYPLYNELKCVYGRLIELKVGIVLQLQYKYKTKDIFKNYNIIDNVAINTVEQIWKDTFENLNFETNENKYELTRLISISSSSNYGLSKLKISI